MPENVRCKDCGFLGVRRKDTREIVEVEDQIRYGGDFPGEDVQSQFLSWSDPIHEVRPLCFAMEEQLSTEARAQVENLQRELQFMEIIDKRRNCDSFTPWKQGFDPKEHWEMLDRKMTLDWRAKEAEKDRAWRENQARIERESRERESSLARDANRIHFWEIVVVASISVLIGVASVVVQIYTTNRQIEALSKQSASPSQTTPPRSTDDR